MDKFDKTMQDVSKMPAEKQLETINTLKGLCICPSCPTYTNCAKNAKELLFCYHGKSFMCIDREKECNCPKCPVTKELELKNKFFCARGAEKAQRYEHTLWGSTMVK
jgi:hypothetical protein